MKTNTLLIYIPTVKSVIFPKEIKFYVYICISMDNRALFMIVKIRKQLRWPLLYKWWSIKLFPMWNEGYLNRLHTLTYQINAILEMATYSEMFSGCWEMRGVKDEYLILRQFKYVICILYCIYTSIYLDNSEH